MIFPKPIANKITRGEVRLAIRPATARPLKPEDVRCVKASQKGEIQCHIVIASVEEMWAGDATFKQVRACGYRTSDDYKTGWVAQFDAPFMKSMLDMEPDQAREAAIARFERRHAGRRAHAISFKLATDLPRFMSTSPVAGKSGDYVRSPAMSIEPFAECVDELTQRRYSEKATREGEAQRASFKRDLERERARRKADRGRAFRNAA